jgi:hypothetical protein
MKSLSSFLTTLLLATVFAFTAQADDKKVDPSGTWTWTSPAGNNRPERKNTLVLKKEGEKITGTVEREGSDGKIDIQDAKLNGDELTFTVVREYQGNKFTIKYSGKVSADNIKGKTEFERNGQQQSRDWEAKKEK